MARQYGFACFLDLEEQRTVGSLLLKQHNPATGADAAYTDNLACDIDDPVARQQAPAVLRQGCEIGAQHVLQGFRHRCAVRQMLGADDQGHILHDPVLTVDFFCQPIERPNMASGAGLGESGLGELSQALRGRGEDRFLVDQVVPNLQKSHLGITANPPDIGFDHRARCLFGICAVAAEKERSNRSARGQPLEVPLPWPGKNLIKIVDCENKVALRRREQSEVHQMHVAAGHHLEIGARGICEISRHDCGASPQKRERRSQHTRHPHRHQLFDTGRILCLKNGNRIRSSACGPEFRMG